MTDLTFVEIQNYLPEINACKASVKQRKDEESMYNQLKKWGQPSLLPADLQRKRLLYLRRAVPQYRKLKSKKLYYTLICNGYRPSELFVEKHKKIPEVIQERMPLEEKKE